MINTIKKTALFIAVTALFLSCTGVFSPKSGQTALSNDESVAVVRVASARTKKTGSARSVSPEADAAFLTSLVLSGAKISGADTVPALAELVKADSFEELSKKELELAAGTWKFELSALYNGIAFSGDTTETLTAGETASLSFTLSCSETNGGFSVTVNFEGSAVKAVANLLNNQDKPAGVAYTDVSLPVTASAGGGSVTFEGAYSGGDTGLEAGTYMAVITFYGDSDETILLNTYREVVRIAGGYVSKADRSISLNSLYQISYEANGGDFVDGESQPLAYSRFSDMESSSLPQMQKSGYAFAGWYEDAAFTTEAFSTSQVGDKTLYACFVNTLYVKQDGSGSGYTESSPVGTVTDAIDKIKTLNDDTIAYTIRIIGEVSRAHVIEDTVEDDGSGNEQTVPIPALTLTVCGQTGTTTDFLNGNFTGYGDPDSDYGTTLTINTTVPVIIKNITITGGYSNDDYGAGISVLGESRVSIEDGTLVTGNHSASAAAGIGINNSAEVTMNAGSKIESNESSYNSEGGFGGCGVFIYGDSDNPGKAKFIMNGGTICKNKADVYGGGVGVMYTGVFEMNDGVIGGTDESYANIASGEDTDTFGGGVYVGSDGTFIMNGGVISHNKATGTGAQPYGYDTPGHCGGGGVGIAYGTFEMKGGEISYNTSARDGGGVYINARGIFKMTEGEILSNTTTDDGKGVYLKDSSGFFYMSGSNTFVDEGNDVYLSGGVITITDDLAGSTVAMITPSSYDTTTQVLQAVPGEGCSYTADVLLERNYGAFKVTEESAGSTVTWSVSSDGYLTNE